MSDADDDTDKRHEPTQKKLDDARKKGDVPRSADLSTAASYGGLLLAFIAAGSGSIERLGNALMVLVDQSDKISILMFEGQVSAPMGGIFQAVGMSVLPWFVIPALCALLVILAQRSFVVAPSKIKPKQSRISPLANAKNKFGRNGLFEFAKSFVKLVIYSVCLGFFIRARFEEIAGVVQSNPLIASAVLVRLGIELLFVVLLVSLAIGAIDYMWQRMEHTRKNMMSDKEIKDEHKDAEGDPHMKQKRRHRAYEIAMSQMMVDVPDADVVIVNPTHFAVALKWSRLPGEAPVCVAKGVDEIALTIRKIAADSGVPIHSDPPTARALHATTDIGVEIPHNQFRAVAAAIRFAENMRNRAKGFS